jgi:DNA-binding transcriptional ArsR family regulator
MTKICADRNDPSISALPFGQAISASTSAVRLHTGGNTYADTADFPVEPPRVAWSVYVADRRGFRTLAADFDASKGDPDRDARDLMTTVISGGLRAVLVESGPTGGRHVFITFKDRVKPGTVALLQDQLAQRYASFDPSCMTPTSTIRPPHAPHRLGGTSRVLDQDPQTALASLREGNDPQLLAGLLTAHGVPAWVTEVAVADTDIMSAVNRLTPHVREILITGKKRHGDQSRSGVVWSVLLGAINAGLDFGPTVAILREPKHRGGERFRQEITRHGEQRALRVIWTEWERAHHYAAANPIIGSPTDVRILLIEQFDLAMQLDWRGIAGNTDRAVYTALIHIAIKNGTLTPTASQRQLAEHAKIERHQTIGISLKRLAKRGLVFEQKRGTGREASTLRLSTALLSEERTTNHLNIGGCEISGALLGTTLMTTQHDVFRRLGLGLSGWQVYSALDLVESLTVAEIARVCGKHPSTVYARFPKLRDAGLAVEVESGLWLRADMDLDDVAVALDVQDATARQHERHEIERQLYREARVHAVRVEEGMTWYSHRRKKNRKPCNRQPVVSTVHPATENSIGLAHIFNVAFDAPDVDHAGMKWFSSAQRKDREELFATFERVIRRFGDKLRSSPSDIAGTIIAGDVRLADLDDPDIIESIFAGQCHPLAWPSSTLTFGEN